MSKSVSFICFLKLQNFSLSNKLWYGFDLLCSKIIVSLFVISWLFNQSLILADLICFLLFKKRVYFNTICNFIFKIFFAHFGSKSQLQLFDSASIVFYFSDCSLIRVLCSTKLSECELKRWEIALNVSDIIYGTSSHSFLFYLRWMIPPIGIVWFQDNRLFNCHSSPYKINIIYESIVFKVFI